MRKSLLPPGGVNKFQMIKQKRREAEAAGISIIDLSVGEPEGGALEPLRIAASKACLDSSKAMWRYQDNECHPVPDFAQRFVECHTETKFGKKSENVSFLPVPGIKPMLGMVIQSLGSWHESSRPATVWTMTKPGYFTPADQAMMAKKITHRHLPMNPDKEFWFTLGELSREADATKGSLTEGDLIMLNLPHNPTGITASRDQLADLCAYCSANGIRLWNDNAYGVLSHAHDYVTLTDIAVTFPQLNWAEGFSASKAGNNTGARVGAIVGSPEFVSDIATIKGNTDSGFVAPMAIAVLELYENHRDLIDGVRAVYQRRLNVLMFSMIRAGLKLAVEPKAGFFILGKCPTRAFGEKINGPGHFNELMIKNTGILGVHFDPCWIRYAVCATDVLAASRTIADGFTKAEVSYEECTEPVAA